MALAAIKRKMQLGQKIQVVRHDWSSKLPASRNFYEVRSVEHVQGNAIRFSGGSWLWWPKASEIRETANGFEVCLNQDGSFREVMVYEYR